MAQQLLANQRARDAAQVAPLVGDAAMVAALET